MEERDTRPIYVLDVLRCEDKSYVAYDLSDYYPPYRGIDKRKMDERIDYVFNGKTAIVKIMDFRNELTYEEAKRIATKWIAKDYSNYRLD